MCMLSQNSRIACAEDFARRYMSKGRRKVPERESLSKVLFFNTPSHLLTECPTIVLTPAIICLSFANCSPWSPFVSMSAIISFVQQYFSFTVLSCSRMK